MTESVALITGASRGIGRAVALRLAELGYNLALLARDTSALAEVSERCEALGVQTCQLTGELTNEAFIRSAVDTVVGQFGHVDVLVNNAGSAVHQAVQSADLSRWRDVMAVNFDAALSLSAKLVPAMIERRTGAVINISSISGRNADAGSAAYAASKHALNGLSGSLFEDVRDFGVKVTSIMPGFVETDLTSAMGLQAQHMIRAEDVADSVAYVLSASSYVCPTEIVLRPQKRP